jgi:hypothetical protein
MARQRLPAFAKLRSGESMDDDAGLTSAFDRAERALQRIEQTLANRRSTASREEALRSRVREVVEELDELIREAAA